MLHVNFYSIPCQIFQEVVSVFLTTNEKMNLRITTSILRQTMTLNIICRVCTSKFWNKMPLPIKLDYTQYIQKLICVKHRKLEKNVRTLLSIINLSTSTVWKDYSQTDVRIFEQFYNRLPFTHRNIKQINMYNIMELNLNLYPRLSKICIQYLFLNEYLNEPNYDHFLHQKLTHNNNIELKLGHLKVESTTTSGLIKILNQLAPRFLVSTKIMDFSINKVDLSLIYSDQMPEFWKHSKTLQVNSWIILLHPDFGKQITCHRLEIYGEYLILELERYIEKFKPCTRYSILSVREIEIFEFSVFEINALTILLSSLPNLSQILLKNVVLFNDDQITQKIFSIFTSAHSVCFRKTGFVLQAYTNGKSHSIFIRDLTQHDIPLSKDWRLVFQAEYIF